MSEMKTYEGGCHCGKVRYQVKMALERVTGAKPDPTRLNELR